MDVLRRQATEELFLRVMECPGEERESCIQRLCEGDEELKQELRQLASAMESGEDFLEKPVTVSPTEPELNRQFSRIGPYRVIRPIRHGGMGSVYLAQRDDSAYNKQVAIKLIRRGLDNDSIVRRFRRERQILASLEHPNIARLLDGGVTEDKLPYLIMEYIEGRPLTQWAEENSLPVSGRLKLFRMVCAAVHYAHQRLVIHLDLKPSNILVTVEGDPKLLDFGIARLLDVRHESRDTLSLHRPFTPDYASPEQIRGENTTIVSDVYSLGIVLYELLTGELPRKLSGLTPAQLMEQAHNASPIPSGALARKGQRRAEARAQRSISADLDNIVAMAMHADPQRRYASAAELSEDIGRSLLGFPIIARPDTVLYRARKFLSRNRAGVAAAGVVCASLVGGMIATTWQAHVAARQRARAQREEQRAEQELNNALKLTHSLLFDYHDAVAGLSGATPVRMKMVQETLAYLQEFEHEASDSPDVRHQLALAYLKVGDVQGRPYRANLGDTAGALSSYGHAVELLAPVAAAHPRNSNLQADLGAAYDALGYLKMRLLDYAGAEFDLAKALDIRQHLAQADPQNEPYRALVASSWQDLGDVYEYSGNIKAAFSAFQQCESLRHSLSAAHPSDLAAQKNWAESLERVGAVHETIADILSNLDDTANAQKARRAAFDSYNSSLRIARTLVAQDPANISYLSMEADVSVYVARMLSLLRQTDRALPLLRTSVSIFSDLSIADPSNHESQFDLIDAQCELATLLAGKRDIGPALSLFDRAVARAVQLLRTDPDNKEWVGYIRSRYSSFGDALVSAGAFQQAMRVEKALQAFDSESVHLNPEEASWSDYPAADMLLQAKLLSRSGRAAAARTLTMHVLASERKRLSDKTLTPAEMVGYGHDLLTCEPEDMEKHPEAMALLQRAAAQGRLPIAAAADLVRAYLFNGQRERALETLQSTVVRLPWPLEAREAAALDHDLNSMAKAGQ